MRLRTLKACRLEGCRHNLCRVCCIHDPRGSIAFCWKMIEVASNCLDYCRGRCCWWHCPQLSWRRSFRFLRWAIIHEWWMILWIEVSLPIPFVQVLIIAFRVVKAETAKPGGSEGSGEGSLGLTDSWPAAIRVLREGKDDQDCQKEECSHL